MRAAVVIPSAREVDPAQLDLLDGDVVIVEGTGFRSTPEVRERATVLTLEQQRDVLGKDFELIGHGSAACRNFGVWWAWKHGYDVIVNLDDDCWPEDGELVQTYVSLLTEPHAMSVLESSDAWVSTLHAADNGETAYPRGFPYEERLHNHSQYEVNSTWGTPAVHVGLWTGTLDLNAVDKLSYRNAELKLRRKQYATNRFISVCAMNFGCTRDWAPYVYQVPWEMFEATCGLERYDDIIGGVFTCGLVRMESKLISFGPPFIDHRKKDADLLTHAWHENLGNVLIGRIANSFQEGISRLENYGTEYDRRGNAKALLGNFEHLSQWQEIGPVAKHVHSYYERWLGLFA